VEQLTKTYYRIKWKRMAARQETLEKYKKIVKDRVNSIISVGTMFWYNGVKMMCIEIHIRSPYSIVFTHGTTNITRRGIPPDNACYAIMVGEYFTNGMFKRRDFYEDQFHLFEYEDYPDE